MFASTSPASTLHRASSSGKPARCPKWGAVPFDELGDELGDGDLRVVLDSIEDGPQGVPEAKPSHQHVARPRAAA